MEGSMMSPAFWTAFIMVRRSLLCCESDLKAFSTATGKSLDAFSRDRHFAPIPCRLFLAAPMAAPVWLWIVLITTRLALSPMFSCWASKTWDLHLCLASSLWDCSPSTVSSPLPSSATMLCTLSTSTGAELSSMDWTLSRMPCVSCFFRSASSISTCRLENVRGADLASWTKDGPWLAYWSTVYLPSRRSDKSFSVLSCACREVRMASTRAALACLLFDTLLRKSRSIFRAASVKVMLKDSSSTVCFFSARASCCASTLCTAIEALSVSDSALGSICTMARDLFWYRTLRIFCSTMSVRCSSIGVIRTRDFSGVPRSWSLGTKAW
mmetsp:Transcript_57181/g.150484  ORF Transcript_57181/g.150484 Transcript_57181/m.150484 type:complete len:325 (+) Transcript_57181:464-1438(+)